jgi:hypothetical protein
MITGEAHIRAAPNVGLADFSTRPDRHRCSASSSATPNRRPWTVLVECIGSGRPCHRAARKMSRTRLRRVTRQWRGRGWVWLLFASSRRVSGEGT